MEIRLWYEIVAKPVHWLTIVEPKQLISDGVDDTEEERTAVARQLANQPELGNKIERLRGFELVWLHSSFCLRGIELHFSAL
jgi:hypothetical protein